MAGAVAAPWAVRAARANAGKPHLFADFFEMAIAEFEIGEKRVKKGAESG